MQQPLQQSTKLDVFLSLDWFEEGLNFLFKLTAKSSEVLLAVGVILSTANNLQHGALFGSSPLLFLLWTWSQAIGFEASAGVMLSMALDANQDRDLIKRNIFLSLMVGLAFVGSVMLIMALVEASTGIQESTLPSWYDITMSILRGVVSLAYVTIGRVKHRRFSGEHVVNAVLVPDVFARLDTVNIQVQQLESSLAQVAQSVSSVNQVVQCLNERQAGQIGSTLQESLLPLTTVLKEQQERLVALHSLGQEVQSVGRQLTHITAVIEADKKQRTMLKDGATITTLQEFKNGVSSANMDKGDFVRSCLRDHPEWRNSDIQKAAAREGMTISPAYISEIRKVFLVANSDTTTEEVA